MLRWIKRKIMPSVMSAIRAVDGSTFVFYITGGGGAGKTTFLRQIGLELGSGDGMTPSFPWSGILDLYHTDVNSNSGLEDRLSRSLERDGEFQPFRDEREAYRAKRESGISGAELETEREAIAGIFAECLNTITAEHRIVIALDTTERIQYELDEAQKQYQLEDQSTSVRPWLTDQLQRWRNCVVLLAGRSEAGQYLEAALEKTLSHKSRLHYRRLTLEGFDEEEAQEFFGAQEDRFSVLQALDATRRSRLCQITDGRPMTLDLALEVFQHTVGFDSIWKSIESLSPQDARTRIEQLFIELVMDGEPDPSLRMILRFLAVARKGLDASLLHHLELDWSDDECQKRLAAIAQRAFVKLRPQDGRLFLHDEMYDICDHHLLLPEVAEVQRLSSLLAAWYDSEVESSTSSASEQRDIRKNLQVDSLLYRLRANPQAGYEWYAKRVDYAIRASDVGFDMRLHNEVVSFLESRSIIDQRLLREYPSLRAHAACDSVVHWVTRFIMRGQNEKAASFASQVLAASSGLCPESDSYCRLARAHLAIMLAESHIYVSDTASATEHLTMTIATLEGDQKPEVLAFQEHESFAGWRRNYALGRGHNNLGYAYWIQRGQYELALRELLAALPYFRASDLREELANTYDNMGRIYALRYNRGRSESLVEDALDIRRQLNREYRYALSLISRAIVHLTFGEPDRARHACMHALRICESLGAQRGIGLACITLGRCFRHLGILWTINVYDLNQSDAFLSDAIRTLGRAVEVFESVNEPVRLVEAYNELGCTYRERAALMQSRDPDSPLTRSMSRDAVKHLNTSIKLAHEKETPVLYVDSCEDLAQTYFQRRDFANARLWLRRGIDSIPEIFMIKEGVGLRAVPLEERIEEYWHQLGKIELLRGHLVYDEQAVEGSGQVSRTVLERALRHYTFAAAYFERFSEQATGIENTFKQLYSRFRQSPIDDLAYLQEHVLPDIKEKFNLDPRSIGKFIEDTLGLAMHLP